MKWWVLLLASPLIAEDINSQPMQLRIKLVSAIVNYCASTGDNRCRPGREFHRFAAEFVQEYRRNCAYAGQGSCNVMIGYHAGVNFIEGRRNSCIGEMTCQDLVKGSYRTEIDLLRTWRP